MGQGNYLHVLVGIFPSDELAARLTSPDEDWIWWDLSIPVEKRMAYEDRPKTSYEADREYIGFPVAGSNGVSGDALEDVGSGRLADFPALMESQAGPAREKWSKFAAWVKARGIDLPPAELLLVADYD